MLIALEEARLAKKHGEVPVGAVILHQNKVIARAHNLIESLKDPLAHAELLAVNSAKTILKQKFFYDCDIYVTLEPCYMCMEAIKLMRFKRLFFAASNHQGVYDRHYHVEIYEGIEAKESQTLLDHFFKELRMEGD